MGAFEQPLCASGLFSPRGVFRAQGCPCREQDGPRTSGSATALLRLSGSHLTIQ